MLVLIGVVMLWREYLGLGLWDIIFGTSLHLVSIGGKVCRRM